MVNYQGFCSRWPANADVPIEQLGNYVKSPYRLGLLHLQAKLVQFLINPNYFI
jgi:hypothetical protein